MLSSIISRPTECFSSCQLPRARFKQYALLHSTLIWQTASSTHVLKKIKIHFWPEWCGNCTGIHVWNCFYLHVVKDNDAVRSASMTSAPKYPPLKEPHTLRLRWNVTGRRFRSINESGDRRLHWSDRNRVCVCFVCVCVTKHFHQYSRP